MTPKLEGAATIIGARWHLEEAAITENVGRGESSSNVIGPFDTGIIAQPIKMMESIGPHHDG